MNHISNTRTPAQTMSSLGHSLNSVLKQTPEGPQPQQLLKVSSALQTLLPMAIENIKNQNNYQAVPPQHLAQLRGALEDSLQHPFKHIEESLVSGREFNVLMTGLRNLLNELPKPAQRVEPVAANAGF
ncbi:MAG: hypothetical protein LW629_05095 [Burkholderiales bacterium]|nr:hypothetical protein [Burkholderiales bacterium]